MRKILILLLLLPVILIVSYFLGPRMAYGPVNNEPLTLDISLSEVEAYVDNQVNTSPSIKPDNESKIIWKDSLKKTPYALVYLHGFEASWAESHPIIGNFANRYECNTYLARISEQGLSDIDALARETPEGMINSAKEAIAIGKLLGEKVIVMSCSTGSTYSSYLAANDSGIYAQIMTSPNFDLEDPNSKLLTGPWGKQIFRKIMGGNYRSWVAPEEAKPYWNEKYRIEGLIALRDLLDQTMTEDIWKQNKVPVFIGYFYVNEEKKDNIISIDAIKKYENTISSDPAEVTVIPFSQGLGHVISSSYMNPHWKTVQDSIFVFAEQTLQMQPTLNELMENPD